MIDLHPGNPWSWTFVVYKDYPFRPGYALGSDGSFWCSWRYNARDRRGELSQTYRRMNARPSSGFYPRITLCYGGPRRTRYLHALVLETFVGPCPEGMECRHLNGNKFDARLLNLRWGTPKENGADTRKHQAHLPSLVRRRGSGNARSKLNEAEVAQIRDLYRGGMPRRLIAECFPVSASTVNSIIKGTTWAHVAL